MQHFLLGSTKFEQGPVRNYLISYLALDDIVILYGHFENLIDSAQVDRSQIHLEFGGLVGLKHWLLGKNLNANNLIKTDSDGKFHVEICECERLARWFVYDHFAEIEF